MGSTEHSAVGDLNPEAKMEAGIGGSFSDESMTAKHAGCTGTGSYQRQLPLPVEH
jgi:hypothetical protein